MWEFIAKNADWTAYYKKATGWKFIAPYRLTRWQNAKSNPKKPNRLADENLTAYPYNPASWWDFWFLGLRKGKLIHYNQLCSIFVVMFCEIVAI